MNADVKSKLSHPKYRPDIDGLRAIAVLSVVAFHAFPAWIKGGFIGVDVFFVISGFLITTIILESLDKGTFSFSEFYSRRIKRIFPALLLVLCSSLFFGWLVLVPEELNQLGKHSFFGTIFSSNFILWNEVDYFDNAAETKPLLHLWSLGIEEQFYIVWPLLLWFGWKKRFNLLSLTIVVAVISLYLNLIGIKKDSVATFFSPQTRFWELLFGSILAWTVLYGKSAFKNIRLKTDSGLNRIFYRDEVDSDGKTLKNIISFFGFSLLVYGLWEIDKDFSFPGKWALIPVLGTTFLILAGPQAWINEKILSRRIIVWFGLISFPLYLWHWPILSFARILEGGVPDRSIRIAAVVISILLAWVTVKLIEKPFRFSRKSESIKLYFLLGAMILLSAISFYVSRKDLTESHGYEKLLFERKGFEHAFGSSLSWYKGKDDWLFLGNAYEDSVAKLKGAIKPTSEKINSTKDIYSKIAKAASENGAQAVLMIGPNKSSIYPEYLPSELKPANKKYLDFFLKELNEVPGLNLYDPTETLISSKKNDEFLYLRTDTHWNKKGAFVAYSGFLKSLDIPIPDVDFISSKKHAGDLIEISKLKEFPLKTGDNFEAIFKEKSDLIEMDIQGERESPFGSKSIIFNKNPLSDKYVWVVGDSFTGLLRPYLNATFKEVRYLGHWGKTQNNLPEEIIKAERKPDLILIVRVERSF